MKVAVPVWNNRVAPVFDVAEKWLSFSVTDKEWCFDCEMKFSGSIPESKVQELLEQRVEYLICGAIPYRFERFLKNSGCRVSAFVAGKPEEVINALLEDNISDSNFYMPGCR